MIINNFDGPTQKEAPNQANDTLTDFSKFDSIICSQNDTTIGFIDNKYSNGADLSFANYMLSKTAECRRNISTWAYAGWNTNGNTVGTVIANSIILNVMTNMVTLPKLFHNN